MNKYLDAAGIALSAIWAAKLRSLMTVLGNIVAVMSIIAVVSLIQGLNASVSRAILNEAGADSFIVQQFGIVRSDEEWLKVQSNPRITRRDADAVKKYSPLVSAVMLSSQARARITYRTASIDGIEVTGVTPEYVNFSNYDAERGRLISPTEVVVDRPAVVIGADLAERLFGPDVDPHRQGHPDPGPSFPRRRRQREARIGARPDAWTSSLSFRSGNFSRCSARGGS